MSGQIQSAAQHLKASRFAKAARECEAILQTNPNQPDALHFLGLAKWQTGASADEAADLIERAMRRAPNQSAMHHNLAAILGSAGDLEKAEQHYRRAIELKPEYAEAYFNLSGVVRFDDTDPLIAGMQQIYARSDTSVLDREFICYALSKAHDDTGRYEEAFHFAIEGSRLRKLKFDPDVFARAVEELKTTSTRELLAPMPDRGHGSQAPVFVVGMPRSGTTLVEQILSRHSDVHGAGELHTIGSFNKSMRMMAERELGYTGIDYGFWKDIPPALLSSAAEAFLKFIETRAGTMPARFTDKMPKNVFHLGLIALMFPNARIIHVRRHPLDTCVSCFMQRFREGQEFSFRLDWLGRYYRLYTDVMDHWKEVLPLQICDVRYEDLVEDTETHARRLIDFVGLDWQQACIDPSSGDREVRTASRWQVRQPVYKTSVERWPRYRAYLDPLIDALGGMDWIESHD
jgi:hypothetical protein